MHHGAEGQSGCSTGYSRTAHQSRHKQWLEETSLNILRPHSTQLKMVDDAIQQYERVRTPATMGKVNLAFEAWLGDSLNGQRPVKGGALGL